jgi:hypothetical protein
MARGRVHIMPRNLRFQEPSAIGGFRQTAGGMAPTVKPGAGGIDTTIGTPSGTGSDAGAPARRRRRT